MPTSREFYKNIQCSIDSMISNNFTIITIPIYHKAINENYLQPIKEFEIDFNVQDSSAVNFHVPTQAHKDELVYLFREGAGLLDILLYYRYELSPYQIEKFLNQEMVERKKLEISSKPVLALHQEIEDGIPPNFLPSLTLKEFHEIKKSNDREFRENTKNHLIKGFIPKDSIREFSETVGRACRGDYKKELMLLKMCQYTPLEIRWHFMNRVNFEVLVELEQVIEDENKERLIANTLYMINNM